MAYVPLGILIANLVFTMPHPPARIVHSIVEPRLYTIAPYVLHLGIMALPLRC